MNVEDAFEALFGFPLITAITNFYEADRDNDDFLSTSELTSHLKVSGFQTANVVTFMESYEGFLNFDQFLNLTNSIPNDVFPKNTLNNDIWGTAISADYSNYYYG